MKVWVLLEDLGDDSGEEVLGVFASKACVRAEMKRLRPGEKIRDYPEDVLCTEQLSYWLQAEAYEVQQLASGPEIFDDTSGLEGLARREAYDVMLEAGTTKLPGVE